MREITMIVVIGTGVLLMFVLFTVFLMIYISKLRRRSSSIESQKVIMDKIINFLDECPTLNPHHSNKVLEMVIQYKDLERGLPIFQNPPPPPQPMQLERFVYRGWETLGHGVIDQDYIEDIDRVEEFRELIESKCMQVMSEKDADVMECSVQIKAYTPPLNLELDLVVCYHREDGMYLINIGDKKFMVV